MEQVNSAWGTNPLNVKTTQCPAPNTIYCVTGSGKHYCVLEERNCAEMVKSHNSDSVCEAERTFLPAGTGICFS